MRFALLNDERIEATKGAKGVCPCCGNDLVAKCGEVYIHHWAHKKKCDDYWWENETEWHRNWKNEFPKEWQEIIQYAESGEKHIADVKTSESWVIEFQHSYLKPEERRSRNNFYKKLIWVVDGTRLKRDAKQFQKILTEESRLDKPSKLLLYVNFPDWSKLLMEWKDSNSLILLDFKDKFSSNEDLWLIYPKMYKNEMFLSQLSRSIFIEYLNNNKFDEIVDKVISPVRKATEHSIKAQERKLDAFYSDIPYGLDAAAAAYPGATPPTFLGYLKLPYGILKAINYE